MFGRILLVSAGLLAASAPPTPAGAQSSKELGYIVKSSTDRPLDAVMTCLDEELRRYQAGRMQFKVVTVTQSTPNGGRGVTETRNPPPRDVNTYSTRVLRIDDRVVAEITARTNRLSVTETGGTQREIRANHEAKRVADRTLAKCAPPIEGDAADRAADVGTEADDDG